MRFWNHLVLESRRKFKPILDGMYFARGRMHADLLDINRFEVDELL